MPITTDRTNGWTSFRRFALISTLIGTLLFVPAVPTVLAQEEAASPTPAGLPPSEINPAAPHVQTVAQGVAGLEGPVVWRVREVSLMGTTAPEIGRASCRERV